MLVGPNFISEPSVNQYPTASSNIPEIPPHMIGVYCGMLSPPILISEVIVPAQVVDMVIVHVITKGSGLILTFDGMMHVIL